jgi:formate hydrogenlyase subunit 3/multisubunit Na+/H+ antiporter MnhD subunit
LSGVFVALVGSVAVIAGLYSIRYIRPDPRVDHGPRAGAGSRTVQTVLPLFVAAMICVPVAGNATTFLVLSSP